MKKTFYASIDQLAAMLQFVRSVVHQSQFEPPIALKIEVAVEEALVNIINYAYPSSEGEIDITCSIVDGGIDITIIDKGIHFDPIEYAKEKYPLQAKSQYVGGYGVQLIMQVMDSVDYFREGEKNILTISKKKD